MVAHCVMLWERVPVVFQEQGSFIDLLHAREEMLDVRAAPQRAQVPCELPGRPPRARRLLVVAAVRNALPSHPLDLHGLAGGGSVLSCDVLAPLGILLLPYDTEG